MPRRETNWKPDVYDLAAEARVSTSEIAAADDFDEIDVQAEPAPLTPLMAEPDKDQSERVVVRYQQPRTSKNSDFYLLGGMIIGSIAGALIGLFKAPARGEETRQNLATEARRQFEHGVNQASATVSRTSDSAS